MATLFWSLFHGILGSQRAVFVLSMCFLMTSVEDRLSALISRLELLESLVGEALSEASALQNELPAVEQPGPELCEEEAPGRPAAATPPVQGRNHCYVVFVAGPGKQVGIYHRYPAYCDAVRDFNQPFDSRRAIPFAAVTESCGAPSSVEAKKLWTARFPGVEAPVFH